jgi:fibro-slime domain-containing protein
VSVQKETNLVARLSRELVLGWALGWALALAFGVGGFGCAKVDQAPTGAGGNGVDAATGAAGTGGGAADDGGAGSTSPFDLNFERPPIAVCGDKVVGFNEGCDDGNSVAGDGCSDFCIVEAGFTCPKVGMPCVRNVVCGDHFIEGTEACDDGNTTSGDGCASDCTLECGWECAVGAACRAAKCGDGKVAGAEQCDDGNTTNGDGCSSLCTLEGKPVAVAEGWVCTSSTTPGTADGGADGGASAACKGPTTCTTTVCGNGKVEGSEQCDDGNKVTGDGCSPFCRLEPKCPATGGACSSVCGDGLLLPADVVDPTNCDDGNTVSGDGCSSTCKQEPGFNCTGIPVNPTTLVLPIVYHDFKSWKDTGGHPDFEHYQGNGQAGIVQPALGANGVPVHVASCVPWTSNLCPPGAAVPTWNAATDWFGMWYVDNATFNKTVVQTLTLPQIAGGGFQFSTTQFFPIDNAGWGITPTNQATATHNFGFTSVTRYWFEYSGAATLSFFGDDDVWVFINKQLAVDLGGTHQQALGSITLDATSGNGFACDFVAPGTSIASLNNCNSATQVGGGHAVTLGLKVGSVYEIVVFQAERFTTESNYQLTLSGFKGTKSSCVGACGDGVMTPPEKCDLGAAKNTGAYGGCNADCSLAPYCGDGKVTNGEECEPAMPGCGADCKKIIVN